MQALEFKLKQQDLTATDDAKAIARDVLSRLRRRPNFGNIGEVENLLSQAKLRWNTRQAKLPLQDRNSNAPFEPQDFDPDYDRRERASTNLRNLFEDVVGCDEIVSKLEDWIKIAENLKARNRDVHGHIPTTFVFKGPPGKCVIVRHYPRD
jgi:hypothetical protein